MTLAENVVQDAAFRALKYFSSFHGDNGRAWLLRIVRNTAHVHLKQRLVATEVAPGNGRDAVGIEGIGVDVADPAPDPEATLAHLEEMALLRAALAALPIEQRECLVLREMEQLSYKEIARIAEVPVGTVMSRLWRARQALISCAPARRFRFGLAALPSS